MARGQLETTTPKEYKETKQRPHPFAHKTKLNQDIIPITAIVFSTARGGLDNDGGHLLRKHLHIIYLTFSGLNFPAFCIPSNVICIIFQQTLNSLPELRRD